MKDWFSGFSEIGFLRPQLLEDHAVIWTALAVLLCIAIFVMKWQFRPRRTHDAQFRLLGRDTQWLVALMLLGLMSVAAAGPYLPGLSVLKSSSSIDIIIAFDKSVSMAVPDVDPSRHEVAVRVLSQFLAGPSVQAGDRMTLFTFSDRSNWRMPLSEDREELLSHVRDIEHPRDRMYLDQSQLYTDISEVLKQIPECLDRQDRFFREKSAEGNIHWRAYPRMVILISDGDNAAGQSIAQPLNEFKRRNIPVYVLGIGTRSGGSVNLRFRTGDMKKPFETVAIQSKLETETLQEIADQTKGKVYLVTGSDNYAQSYLAAAVATTRNDIPRLIPTEKPESFWWVLLAVPSLLLVAYMILRS